jgi:hypothetical protein
MGEEREGGKEGRKREREIMSEELARLIMEAKKSHDLPSTSWRLKKAGVRTPKV